MKRKVYTGKRTFLRYNEKQVLAYLNEEIVENFVPEDAEERNLSLGMHTRVQKRMVAPYSTRMAQTGTLSSMPSYAHSTHRVRRMLSRRTSFFCSRILNTRRRLSTKANGHSSSLKGKMPSIWLTTGSLQKSETLKPASARVVSENLPPSLFCPIDFHLFFAKFVEQNMKSR